MVVVNQGHGPAFKPLYTQATGGGQGQNTQTPVRDSDPLALADPADVIERVALEILAPTSTPEAIRTIDKLALLAQLRQQFANIIALLARGLGLRLLLPKPEAAAPNGPGPVAPTLTLEAPVTPLAAVPVRDQRPLAQATPADAVVTASPKTPAPLSATKTVFSAPETGRASAPMAMPDQLVLKFAKIISKLVRGPGLSLPPPPAKGAAPSTPERAAALRAVESPTKPLPAVPVRDREPRLGVPARNRDAMARIATAEITKPVGPMTPAPLSAPVVARPVADVAEPVQPDLKVGEVVSKLARELSVKFSPPTAKAAVPNAPEPPAPPPTADAAKVFLTAGPVGDRDPIVPAAAVDVIKPAAPEKPAPSPEPAPRRTIAAMVALAGSALKSGEIISMLTDGANASLSRPKAQAAVPIAPEFVVPPQSTEAPPTPLAAVVAPFMSGDDERMDDDEEAEEQKGEDGEEDDANSKSPGDGGSDPAEDDDAPEEQQPEDDIAYNIVA